MSSGRAYVVTGATGALGRAVVERLLARGDRVAVSFRDRARFEALRSSLDGQDRLWGAPANIADEAALRQFAAAAERELGSLDGAALVAGSYRGGSTLDQAPADEWSAMLESNLATAHAACRALVPLLLERGGSIVTVGSRQVRAGGARAAAYAVSKAAVHALTRALALENSERLLRFNLVAPGIIDTEANRAAMPQADRSGWTPASDIARVIAFLMSPASSPITGAQIPGDVRLAGDEQQALNALLPYSLPISRPLKANV